MSSYMMMPKDYARELMQRGQREKATAFMEYMFDLDEQKNNSIGFYANSWGKSKSTAHAWVKEFGKKVAEHYDFWAIQNEIKYRTVAERQPNDLEKKSNAQTPINTGFIDNTPNALPNDNRTVAEQRVNTKILNKSISGKKRTFIPPTITEIKSYIQEKNLVVDAETFYFHYESQGWMIGKNKMKSWTATIQNWNRKNKINHKFNTSKNKEVLI